MVDKGAITVDSIPEVMERLNLLHQDATAADGWTQLLDDPAAAGWTMQNEAGDTLLRTTLHLDLSPQQCFEMIWCTTDDCLNWKPWKTVETLEQISQDEKIIRFQPDVSWAV